MNRRNFLKMMLGGAAVAVAPVLALAPKLNPLMSGEIGHLDGFSYHKSPNEDELLDAIVKAAKVLDDAGIPKNGRWVAVQNEAMLEQIHIANNPSIVTEHKGWGTGIVARPHTIKIQRDMNNLIRSAVVE